MCQGDRITIGTLAAAVEVVANKTLDKFDIGVGVDVAVLAAAVEGTSDTSTRGVSIPMLFASNNVSGIGGKELVDKIIYLIAISQIKVGILVRFVVARIGISGCLVDGVLCQRLHRRHRSL